MELFFRKYFWTVTLTFIALVALLAARTVNVFIEAKIAPLPAVTTERAPARVTPVTERKSLSVERLAKLTGLPLPVPEPAVAEPTTPEFDPNSDPVRTSLRVKLLGTLVAGRPEWSFASVQDMGTLKSETFMVGDLIQGAEVIDIERERVIINNQGRKEFISNEPGDGAPVAAYVPPAPPTGAPAPNVTGSGIRSTGDNEYEVPRAEIDRTLANLNDVAMQARIVPAFKDGQAQGFKLFSIRPDSIYTKIGIQNGDVIRRINGFELNSPEKALEVYSKLKEAGRIDIEVERNGSVVRKTYNVR
jgi:general secretion pathway protein C